MIVISDTSPILYLLLINQLDLLPQMYGQVIIPEIVRDELAESIFQKRSPNFSKQIFVLLLD